MSVTANGRPTIGIGMVGYAFMGRAHSQAWRTVSRAFNVPLVPQLVALAGRDATRGVAAAHHLGWDHYEMDWHRLIAREDVELIDVASPGSSHAEISIAALRAGKHVLCEKPLANTVEEAEAMAREAASAAKRGVRTMVGFNYRRIPAVTFARQLIADGNLGTIRHVRAVFLQDWLVDPAAPMTWRMRKEDAGSGALGDIAAHIIDLTQYLLDDRIAGVSALAETFVKERPLAADPSRREAVTVDDAVAFVARFGNGALATFEATRFATGRKNSLRFEINGALGSLAFDLESLNELSYYDGREPAATRGFRRILVTEATHPYVHAWWPPGHLLGYEHTFTHEVYDLLDAIANGRDPVPSFAEGLDVQRVLDAVARSAAGAGWIAVTRERAS